MSAFSRSYAAAFLATAPPHYDVDGFLARAGAVARVLQREPKLKAFFSAPSIPSDPKRRVLDGLTRKAELDEFARRFFQVLLAHRRLLELARILTTLREESDRANGVVEAHITVAAEIDDLEREKISRALTRLIGRRVRLATDVDERILGGFVARVGSEVFDASVRHAVERFQQQSTQGAKV